MYRYLADLKNDFAEQSDIWKAAFGDAKVVTAKRIDRVMDSDTQAANQFLIEDMDTRKVFMQQPWQIANTLSSSDIMRKAADQLRTYGTCPFAFTTNERAR